MRSLSFFLLPAAFGSLLAFSTSAAPAQNNPAQQSAVNAAFGSLPLSFEPNQGQADSQVRFLSRGAGYSLFLTDSGAVLSLGEASSAAKSPSPLARGGPRTALQAMRQSATPDVVRMELIGASQSAQAEAASPLPGVVSYFIGNDPTRWRTNIPTYARVKYESVYPDVDLVYYGNQGRLEYDFVVAPGADANAVRFRLSGAKHLAIDSAGNIRIASGNGSLQINKPVVYQEENGVRRRVEGRFQRIGADTIGFQLGRYNRALPLTIDPVLIYSTFLGVGDSAAAIAVDASGNTYVTGTTANGLPTTTGAFQTTDKATWSGIGPWKGTAFVTKLNATGTALIYSTFLGGSEFDHGQGIAIDNSGNAYVAGYTDSTDFPTTKGAVQPKTHASSSSDYNGFVTKLNATGTALVYSTYLGGSGGPAWAGGDGYFFGGDSAGPIAVDSKGNAYVASEVESKDFPVTQEAFQPVNRGQYTDSLTAAVTKLNPEGSAFVYSTYLGGSGWSAGNEGDTPTGISLDASGNVYVTGGTYSLDFPVTTGAYQTAQKNGPATPYGHGSSFVTKLNSTGSGLVYSTYLGGTVFEQTYGIVLDGSGNAYVTGQTSSADFPITKGAFETTYPSGNPLFSGNETDFVTKLNPDGTALVYSTYLGGSVAEWNYGGIAVDSSDSVYIAGQTWSPDFPVTPGAYIIAVPTGRPTGFLSRLNAAGSALLYSTYLGGSYQDAANAVAKAGTGVVIVAGSADSSDFPVTTGAFQTTFSGAPTAFVTKFDTGVLVTRPAVKLTLSSSANPALVGTNVTITATVSGGSNTIPSGYVLISADGLLEENATTSAGIVTWSTSTLALGKHTITAQFRSPEYAIGSATEVLTVESLAAPAISPAGGTFSAPQSVTMTDSYKGAVILYTTDGSTPTIDSKVYRSPITVASKEKVQAMALVGGASGNILSPVSAAVFSITGAPLTSPSPNSVLAGPKVTFTWSAFPGAASYTLRLGSSLGANNLYGSGPIAATSAAVTNLPTNGETIYARLYTQVGSLSLYADYTFTAAKQAALTKASPVLAGPKATFTWSAATGSVSGYFFRLGTSVGANNLYASGAVTATSVTPDSLPLNGKTIYARLYTNYTSGAQAYTDYTFTAATSAALNTPTPGTGLPGINIIFQWSAATGGVTSYRFRLGTSAGSNNIYDSGPITPATTSVEVTNLPSNSEKIYARLYTNYNSGAQVYTDYTYTAYTLP